MRNVIDCLIIGTLGILMASCSGGGSSSSGSKSKPPAEDNVSDVSFAIETMIDGSGIAVSTQSLVVGNSTEYFAIARTKSGTFIEAVPAIWSLTGSIGTLTEELNGKKASFSPDNVGEGSVRATYEGLTRLVSVTVTASPIAELSLSPETNLGMNVTGGSSPGAAVTLTLGNTGSADSGTLVTPSLSGTGADHFQLVAGQDNCTGEVLAPAETCTFQVEPISTVNTSYVAAIEVSDSAVTSNSASLTGQATGFAGAALSLSPAVSADMDITGGSSPGAEVTFTVENTGDAVSASLSAPEISGAGAGNFQVVSGQDNCTGNTLAASATCTFQIEPIASGNGTYAATVAVSGGAIDSNTAAVSGEASGFPADVQLALSPATNTSMDISDGSSPGAAVTLTLQNNGADASSTLLAPVLAGTNPSNFELVSGQDNCTGNTLAASATCTFQVRPVATIDGSYAATVSVADGDFTSTSASLAGEASGFTADVQLALSPAASTGMDISGGSSPGAAVTLTLQNNGTDASSTLSTPAFSGANPSNFELVSGQNNCTGNTLAAGANCTFQVRPVATTNLSYAATVSLGDGDFTSNTASLSGEASGFAAGDSIFFVSSTKHMPSSIGGVTGADRICQQLADNVGLASPYRAVISSSTVDARDRVAIPGALKMPTGTVIANDAADFWDGSNVVAQHNITESGAAAVNSYAWTGSTAAGVAIANTCSDWTTNTGTGGFGDFGWTNSKWFANGSTSCNQSAHIYCIGPEAFNLNLIATAGDVGGEIDLSVRLPSSVFGYSSIVLRRVAGDTPPSASCNDAGDTIITTASGPFSSQQIVNYTDETGEFAGEFSYRACIYDSGSALIASTAAASAMSKDGTHYIFISSTTTNASLGGLTGADARCQALADARSIGGNWSAVLSDSTVDVRDRLAISYPVRDMVGSLVAANETALWSSGVLKPVQVNEAGGVTTGRVWTGSLSDGTKAANNCNNWTNGAHPNLGQFGESHQTNGTWVGGASQTQFCNAADARLYCISEAM